MHATASRGLPLFRELQKRYAINNVAVEDERGDASRVPDVDRRIGIENEDIGATAGRDLPEFVPAKLQGIIVGCRGKGFARRVRNPEDGRSYLLELTPKGKATNARAAARFDEMMARLLGNLAGERETILEHMRVLEDAMRRSLPD